MNGLKCILANNRWNYFIYGGMSKMAKLKGKMVLSALVLALALAGGCSSNPADSTAGNSESGTSIVLDGNWKIIKQEGKDDIRVLNLTDVRQATYYTCGVSALQTILFYYGIEYQESTLAEFAGSSADAGTPPEGIVQAVGIVNREDGTDFTAEIRQNATIDDLKELIDAGIPVIVDIQAWRDEDEEPFWKDDWIDGHYVVAIGYDDDNIYFEEPCIMNSIGSIPYDELLDRWHDYEGAEDFDPATSRITQNLIIVIQGEEPYIFDPVLHID